MVSTYWAGQPRHLNNPDALGLFVLSSAVPDRPVDDHVADFLAVSRAYLKASLPQKRFADR